MKINVWLEWIFFFFWNSVYDLFDVQKYLRYQILILLLKNSTEQPENESNHILHSRLTFLISRSHLFGWSPVCYACYSGNLYSRVQVGLTVLDYNYNQIFRWRMDKFFGLVMIVAYVVFCIFSIFLETGHVTCPLRLFGNNCF